MDICRVGVLFPPDPGPQSETDAMHLQTKTVIVFLTN